MKTRNFLVKFVAQADDLVMIGKRLGIYRVRSTSSIVGSCIKELGSVVMAVSIHMAKFITELKRSSNKL